MRPRRKPADQAPSGYVGDHADKLSHVPPLAHDDDERQSGQDREAYRTLFTNAAEPVRYPRWLRPRRRRGKAR
jgi:hypothetical protein